MLFITLLLSCSSDHEPGTSRAAVLERMQIIGDRSIKQLLQIDPVFLHDAWTKSVSTYADATCPPMEEHNGMDLWRESCTTSQGHQFLGWALNLRIDQITENGYEWDVQDWLSGQARIISNTSSTGEVELSNYGDVLHEAGTTMDNRKALHGMIFGNFGWTAPEAHQTWLSKSLNIEYEYWFEQNEQGTWGSEVNAWLSNFDDEYFGEAVIWEDITFHEERCKLEPTTGLLWIREGEGKWITLQFDNECDGCGVIAGSNKQMCLDFTPWFDWDTVPWEERDSIQWGLE